MTPRPSHASPRRTSGSALIVTLGLVVVVTAMVTAFLASSTLGRQISKSSSSQAAADVFAKGALAVTVGDLLQEIVDGSTATPAGGTTVYLPKANATMIPMVVGGNAALPNLVKRSSSNPFYTGASYNASGVNRGSGTATTVVSANGRAIKVDRWNKPLLLPKATPSSATDLTPPATFSAPEWVYVDVRSTTTAPPTLVSTNVIARYAYTIYNEGGLLNANTAGYPPDLDPASAARKMGTPTADLTQIGLSASQIRNLVGWRNYSTYQPSGTFPSYGDSGHSADYYTGVLSNDVGFLTVATPLLLGQSDHRFHSRQQLIQFLTQGIGTNSTDRATLQTALQYLGTFSRDLNQPSFYPATGHPNIAGNTAYALAAAGGNITPTAGANDAYSKDATVNPNLLTVRVSPSFTRNDGSTAAVNDPLVKKRFALNRLSWITYKGPIANFVTGTDPAAQGDPLIVYYLAQGVPFSLIKAGTQANITKYFGLTWDNGNKLWTYFDSTSNSDLGKILTLSQVAAQARDPDFFELLKAGTTAGSLGKAAATNHNLGGAGTSTTTNVDADQQNLDTKIDLQLMQVGANMIDQFDPDAYPTHLVLGSLVSPVVGTCVDVYGIENLPYLYRARTVGIVADTALVRGPALNAGGIKGKGLALLLPEVWNPHDTNCPRTAVAGLAPTNFRFVLAYDTRRPIPAYVYPPSGTTAPGYVANTVYALAKTRAYRVDDTAAVTSSITNGSVNEDLTTNATASGRVTPNNGAQVDVLTNPGGTVNFPGGTTGLQTELDFTIPATGANATACAYPVFLGTNNSNALTGGNPNTSGAAQAAAIGLTVGPRNALATAGYILASYRTTGNYVKDVVSGLSYCGVLLGDFPLVWNQGYAYDAGVLSAGGGFYQAPPDTTTVYPSTEYPVGSGVHWTQNSAIPNHNPAFADQCFLLDSYRVDYVLQYQDGNGWHTYQDNIGNIPGSGSAKQIDITHSNPGPGVLSNINETEWETWIDPRTSRFGLMDGTYSRVFPSNPSTVVSDSSMAGYFNKTNRPSGDWGQGTTYSFPGSGAGAGTKTTVSAATAASIGWYPGNWAFGTPAAFFPGAYADNIKGARGAATHLPAMASPGAFFTDPDGVLRRGMGAFAISTGSNGDDTRGMPQAQQISGTAGTAPSPYYPQSRPWILNRPFRSVAELGYVFSGTPWRNLSFSMPESGAAGLADVFCINETSDPKALTDGKVDLNTRQPLVLAALLSGGAAGSPGYAYKDEFNPQTASAATELSSTEATAIANLLISRTTSAAAGKGPLLNLSDLVGRWNASVAIAGATAPHNVDGALSYSGFSYDLATAVPPVFSDNDTIRIQRFQEAAIRPLLAGGQVRVWNLMIDLFAQTGHFTPAAAGNAISSNGGQFVVDGERRYWLHVAIDRYTGKVLDEQLEPVEE